MGKLVVASLTVLLVINVLIATSNADVIGYPALAKGGAPIRNPPPSPSNEYRRGCNPAQGCRGGAEEDKAKAEGKEEKKPELDDKTLWMV